MPLVSVVVPTYRRPQALRRCLNALVTQSMGPGSYEIIVVDDGRSEDARAVVEHFTRQHRNGPAIRYLRPPGGARGPAAARNAGWRAAETDIIAFTDDDTIPAHDWLAEGLRALRGDLAAVWGDVIVPLPEAPSDSERNTAGLDGAEFVTANCFVRRSALAAVGGFDERFLRPWREDSDLYFTLLEQARKVAKAPSAIVIHPALEAPPAACLRQHRNLFFDALLYKKHPRLYREKISAAPPLRYYAIVALLILAAGASLAGQAALAATAAAGWLILTALLAARRLRGISRRPADVAGIVLTSAVIPALAVYWRLAGVFHFRVLFA